jgi:hypothetical protein
VPTRSHPGGPAPTLERMVPARASRWAGLTASALLLALGGCGGAQCPERNAHSEALAPSLVPGDDNGVDDAARQCVASEVVDVLGGPSALGEAGISPTDLAEADDLAAIGLDIGAPEAQQVADSLEPCGISVVDLLVAELELPPETRRCVEDNLDPQALRSFIVMTIVGETADAAATDAVIEPVVGCFPD